MSKEQKSPDITWFVAYLFKSEWVKICVANLNSPDDEHLYGVIIPTKCLIFNGSKKTLTFKHPLLSKYKVPYTTVATGLPEGEGSYMFDYELAKECRVYELQPVEIEPAFVSIGEESFPYELCSTMSEDPELKLCDIASFLCYYYWVKLSVKDLDSPDERWYDVIVPADCLLFGHFDTVLTFEHPLLSNYKVPYTTITAASRDDEGKYTFNPKLAKECGVRELQPIDAEPADVE